MDKKLRVSNDAGTSNIAFASDIVANVPEGDRDIHDNESFLVQWSAQNAGTSASPGFTDLLVISSIPEGCPGDDNADHPIVFNSERDADNPQDFLEGPLDPGQTGSLMQPRVGPFAAGSYRLTVTLAQGISNTTLFSCIDILPAAG
jgi:hypothetical protein